MKDGLSDFIKEAYRQNRVKDVSEAFKEYPPEEEWHKGKIENILSAVKKCENDLNKNKKSSYNNLKKTKEIL